MKPSDASVQPRSRPLVLVVEDEGDIAHLIARVLTPTKYDFLLTTTGADAIRHAVEARPDVITLDILLPDIDGREILRMLREDPRTHNIPVIVVSIRADEDDDATEMAFATLPKPIDRDALRATVARATASSRTS